MFFIEQPIPDLLTMQVVDEDSKEIVEQVRFRLEHDHYLPVDTTEEVTP